MKENVSESLLHTVSRKHVVQPGNRNKMLGTCVSLNVPQVIPTVTQQQWLNQWHKLGAGLSL